MLMVEDAYMMCLCHRMLQDPYVTLIVMTYGLIRMDSCVWTHMYGLIRHPHCHHTGMRRCDDSRRRSRVPPVLTWAPVHSIQGCSAAQCSPIRVEGLGVAQLGAVARGATDVWCTHTRMRERTHT